MPKLPVSVSERAPCPQEKTLVGKLLNAVVAGLGHIDIALRTYADSVGMVELGLAGAEGTPRKEKDAFSRELLNASFSLRGVPAVPQAMIKVPSLVNF